MFNPACCTIRFLCVLVAAVAAAGCARRSETVVAEEVETTTDLSALGFATLSAYGFFTGPLQNLEPAAGVVHYELNSALFTDYALKKRFVKIPDGKKAQYHPTEVFDFPEGTVLIKNFFYPADFRKPAENIRILETRLLILERGVWKALNYIWNDEQTEAHLDVAGKTVPLSWTHNDGVVRNVNYSIPNNNQCKGCHMRGNQVAPIGPTARQLNGRLPERPQTQLVQWQNSGLLEGLPAEQHIPRLVSYEDGREPVAARARAWLEINCAHCHHPDGPAKGSGLHLLANVPEGPLLGIGKAPVAAGKGSGGRLFGIVPGKPEASILQHRIESTHPGVMMPELGRTLVHEEGVALVRQWILEMR
jgi:uncharacterized repeat protein (TIGR03806 family)